MVARISRAYVVAALTWALGMTAHAALGEPQVPATSTAPTAESPAGLPRLVDYGSKTCVPCKMMAPILEELKHGYASKFDVEFVDVSLSENLPRAQQSGVKSIPTQVFLDAAGKELWRHEGFISKEDILAKWKDLGHDFSAAIAPATDAAAFERWKPDAAHDSAEDRVCYMCDGAIDPKTLVTVKTDNGDVRFCGPHCYFIMYSCLAEDKTGLEEKVSVTDFQTLEAAPIKQAIFLYSLDDRTGRPIVKAFGHMRLGAACQERNAFGGSIIGYKVLKDTELACRCGFCDRACYAQDAARVIVAGVNTWGCCCHCALGVAARTGKDIEVHQPDRLTGEMIVVKTLGGRVAVVEPATAVAWFGMRPKPDGSWASAGCFHQAFFSTPENLRKWAEQNPTETGKQITIEQALADKMKLTPQQIQKACKIGQCTPK